MFCDYRADLPSELSCCVFCYYGNHQILKFCGVVSNNGKAERGLLMGLSNPVTMKNWKAQQKKHNGESSPLRQLESQLVLDHGSIWYQLGALLSLAYTTQSSSRVPAISTQESTVYRCFAGHCTERILPIKLTTA